MKQSLTEELYKVFVTTNVMLQKRQYTGINRDLRESIEYDDFVNNYLTLRDLYIEASDKNGKIVEVHFLEDLKKDAKVGIKPIRTCLDSLKEKNRDHAIIIVKEGITSFALGKIDSESKGISESGPILGTVGPKLTIETFRYFELMIDITEHVLVPKHTLLTPEEKQAVMDRYSAKEHQFPNIQSTDAVCKFYGFKRGEIIEIERVSETAGICKFYRRVV